MQINFSLNLHKFVLTGTLLVLSFLAHGRTFRETQLPPRCSPPIVKPNGEYYLECRCFVLIETNVELSYSRRIESVPCSPQVFRRQYPQFVTRDGKFDPKRAMDELRDRSPNNPRPQDFNPRVPPAPDSSSVMDNNPYLRDLMNWGLGMAIKGLWNGFDNSPTQKAWESFQRNTPVPEHILKDLDNYINQTKKNLAEMEQVQKDIVGLLQEIRNAQNGLSKFDYLPPEQIPVPLPQGVSETRVKKLLDPLWEASSKQNFTQGAEAINQLLKHMQNLEGPAPSWAKKEGQYLRQELSRLFLNQDLLFKNLPTGRTPDLGLTAPLSSPEGLRLRQALNELIAAEAQLNQEYLGQCAQNICGSDKRLQMKMAQAQVRMDRLYHQAKVMDRLWRLGQKTPEALDELTQYGKDFLQKTGAIENPEELGRVVEDFLNETDAGNSSLYNLVQEHRNMAQSLSGPQYTNSNHEGTLYKAAGIKDCLDHYETCSREKQSHSQWVAESKNSLKENIENKDEEIAQKEQELSQTQNKREQLEKDLLRHPENRSNLESQIQELNKKEQNLSKELQFAQKERKIMEIEAYDMGTLERFSDLMNVRERLQEATSIRAPPGSVELGQGLIKVSGDSLIDDDRETGDTVLHWAKQVTDVALGLTPGVSVGKDVYELVTGVNLVTGEELSTFDRSMAAIGIVTLGTSNGVRTAVKALGKATTTLEALAHSKKGLTQGIEWVKNLSDKTTLNGLTYLNKTRFEKTYKNYSLPDMERLAQSYADLERKFPELELSSFKGDVYRYAPKRTVGPDGVVRTLTEEDVFKFHEKMIPSNGRFSMGGELGEPSLYGSIGEEVLAKQTAHLEAGAGDLSDLVLGKKHFQLNRVLELSSEFPENLRKLNLSENDVLKVLREDPKAYEITHQLGHLAKKNNIDAIIFRSSLLEKGTNISILNERYFR